MIDKLVTYNWRNALSGMRNPLRSWDKMDTIYDFNEKGVVPTLGPNDLQLCKKLIKAGASHRKFLRQIIISFDLTACLKFFDEFSTYLHVVSNSTSQMHSIHKKNFRFNKDNFCNKFNTELSKRIFENLLSDINLLLDQRQYEKDIDVKKKIWREIIDLIPQSFLYIRTITMNYEVFLAMYHNRKNHKMEEWVEFCDTLRKELPYMDEFLKILGE